MNESEDYATLAAEFIAGVGRYARLGLPVLPEDPAGAAAMRAAGYDVLTEITEVDGAVTMVSVLAEDEEIQHPVSTRQLAERLTGTSLVTCGGSGI